MEPGLLKISGYLGFLVQSKVISCLRSFWSSMTDESEQALVVDAAPMREGQSLVLESRWPGVVPLPRV